MQRRDARLFPTPHALDPMTAIRLSKETRLSAAESQGLVIRDADDELRNRNIYRLVIDIDSSALRSKGVALLRRIRKWQALAKGSIEQQGRLERSQSGTTP